MLERAAASGCPFLCGLRYAFRAGPWLVLALPLYSGGTLQLNLDERSGSGPLGGLPLDEVRFVAAQLTLALEAMHGMGMIHRDVKPSNAILDRRGYLKLSDFGLSAKIGATSKSGTRGYWSPETIQRLAQGEAADWWSLGVTLCYVACGRQPFHRRCERRADGTLVWEPWDTPTAEPADGGGDGAAEAEAEADHPRNWKRRLSVSDLRAEERSPGLEVDTALPAGTPRTPAAAEAVAAAEGAVEGAPRRKGRFSEEALNYNTLHMPIDLPAGMPAALVDFLLRLLERSPERRLGADGGGDVRSHPFIGGTVEWDLLEKQTLVPPFTPDPGLVYTPDRISDFSEEVAMPDDELLDHFRDWRYDGEPVGYQEELAAFVQKSSTRQILSSMRAPEDVLAKYELVSDTQSETEKASAAGSEGPSADGFEYDNEQIADYDSDEDAHDDEDA